VNARKIIIEMQLAIPRAFFLNALSSICNIYKDNFDLTTKLNLRYRAIIFFTLYLFFIIKNY